MGKILILMILVMLGCHTFSSPYVYLSVPGDSAVVPLKVYRLHVEGEFTDSDKSSIVTAVSHWNFALNGYVRIEIVDMEYKFGDALGEDDWTIVKIDHFNSRVRDGKVGQKLAFADAVGGKHLWVVRDRIKDGWMTGIILHEIGHLLGARHDGRGLMHPNFVENGYVCVDDAALRQVSQHQGIPYKRLNFCVRYDKDFFDK